MERHEGLVKFTFDNTWNLMTVSKFNEVGALTISETDLFALRGSYDTKGSFDYKVSFNVDLMFQTLSPEDVLTLFLRCIASIGVDKSTQLFLEMNKFLIEKLKEERDQIIGETNGDGGGYEPE